MLACPAVVLQTVHVGKANRDISDNLLGARQDYPSSCHNLCEKRLHESSKLILWIVVVCYCESPRVLFQHERRHRRLTSITINSLGVLLG